MLLLIRICCRRRNYVRDTRRAKVTQHNHIFEFNNSSYSCECRLADNELISYAFYITLRPQCNKKNPNCEDIALKTYN